MRSGRDLAGAAACARTLLPQRGPSWRVRAKRGAACEMKLRIIMDCSPPFLWYFSTQEAALWACSTPTEDQGTFAKSRSPSLMLSLGYCMRRRHQIFDAVS